MTPEELEKWANSQKSMDAKEWADRFNDVLVEKGQQPFDTAWLIGWFANAIMTGYDEGRRKGRSDQRARDIQIVRTEEIPKPPIPDSMNMFSKEELCIASVQTTIKNIEDRIFSEGSHEL